MLKKVGVSLNRHPNQLALFTVTYIYNVHDCNKEVTFYNIRLTCRKGNVILKKEKKIRIDPKERYRYEHCISAEIYIIKEDCHIPIANWCLPYRLLP